MAARPMPRSKREQGRLSHRSRKTYVRPRYQQTPVAFISRGKFYFDPPEE
jgi:hypothetical protein